MHYDPQKNELTICDFGLAVQKKDPQNPNAINPLNPAHMVQSLWYRAPERVLFKEYDERIDIWSFACILFELYTRMPMIWNPGGDKDEKGAIIGQTIIDHLHLMFHVMGESLSKEFIESIPSSDIKEMFEEANGTYKIRGNPSAETEDLMKIFSEIANDYPGKTAWQAYIYEACKQKQENKEIADALIGLLSPMLRYENRIDPQSALNQFFPDPHLDKDEEEDKENTIKRSRPNNTKNRANRLISSPLDLEPHNNSKSPLEQPDPTIEFF
jgi:serine/threonine protein kinase